MKVEITMSKKNTLNYKEMKIDDIMNWCVANKQVAWLKETAAKEVPCKVYPRMTVEYFDEKTGKFKTKSVADKSKKAKTEMRPISFIQLKKEFALKFMPEIMPKAKAAAPTMYDLIAALEEK